MSLPSNLKYTDEHVWVKEEDNGTYKVGITDNAQDELGDIVFVELPEEDDELAATETFGSVESVKTVSELYAPISGTVVEVNEELEDSPELINSSPYDEGWMVIVKPTDTSELEKLQTAEDYQDFLDEE